MMNIEISDHPPSYNEAIEESDEFPTNEVFSENLFPPSYEEATGGLVIQLPPNEQQPNSSYTSTSSPITALEVIEHQHESSSQIQTNPISANENVNQRVQQPLPSTSRDLLRYTTREQSPSKTFRLYIAHATLKPYANTNPKKDAAIIRNALESNQKDILIKILCHRSSEQRHEIAKAYNVLYGLSLSQQIKNLQSSKNFYLLIYGLVAPIHQFIADAIYKNSSYKWMCYIVFTLSNYEREAMRKYSKLEYGWDIVDLIKSRFQNDESKSCIYKQIIYAFERTRDETKTLNEDEIRKSVNYLKSASVDSKNREYARLIFYCKNFKHINEVCTRVQRETNTSINTIIVKSFGESCAVIQSILAYAKYPSQYFAQILKTTGANDLLMMIIILMRCEIDMVDIKHAFELSNNCGLRKWIHDGTSGYYKYALYELIGERRRNQ